MSNKKDKSKDLTLKQKITKVASVSVAITFGMFAFSLMNKRIIGSHLKSLSSDNNTDRFNQGGMLAEQIKEDRNNIYINNRVNQSQKALDSHLQNWAGL